MQDFLSNVPTASQAFSWTDETAVEEYDSTAVAARSVAVVAALANLPNENGYSGGDQAADTIITGITTAITALTKRGEYDAIRWLMCALEGVLPVYSRAQLPLTAPEPEGKPAEEKNDAA